jgi:hypothetical protein
MLSDLLKVSISSLSWGTWEVVMQDGSWGFVVLAAPLIYMVLVAYLPAGTLMLSGMLLMYAGLGIVVFGAAAGGIGVAMTAPLGIALASCGLLLVGMGGCLQAVLRHLAKSDQMADDAHVTASYFRLLTQRQQQAQPRN